MTDSTHVTVLRRMTQMPDQRVIENPLTSSRAVRLALTKAANDAVGLVLTVSSVAETTDHLDDMLAGLPDGLLLVELHQDSRLVGLMALDMQLRAAVLEIQTTGKLIGRIAEDRAPTRTDKVMCDPMIADFLSAFPTAVSGTSLEGWCDRITHAEAFESKRTAGLLLDDCAYRSVQMNVDLGVADRQGVLIVVLPMTTAPQVSIPVKPPCADWGDAFHARIENAPAVLTALLHRFSVSIAQAQSLVVGQILPLTGCTVHSVRMVAADGRDVGAAKLGQSGGMRAIRIEAAPPPALADLMTSTPEADTTDTLLENALSPELAPALPDPVGSDFADAGDAAGFPALGSALEDRP